MRKKRGREIAEIGRRAISIGSRLERR